jgi:hypothetical protein
MLKLAKCSAAINPGSTLKWGPGGCTSLSLSNSIDDRMLEECWLLGRSSCAMTFRRPQCVKTESMRENSARPSSSAGPVTLPFWAINASAACISCASSASMPSGSRESAWLLPFTCVRRSSGPACLCPLEWSTKRRVHTPYAESKPRIASSPWSCRSSSHHGCKIHSSR